MGLLRFTLKPLSLLSVGPWGHDRATSNAAVGLEPAGPPDSPTLSPPVADDQPEPSAADRALERDRVADVGDRLAELDDVEATQRDRAAGSRDIRSQTRAPAASSPDALAAAIDRQKSLEDRQSSAGDRVRAAQDREHAGTDRTAAAAALVSSHYDELTGMYRRDAGLIEVEREIARAGRNGHPYVLAYIDVDGMKARNDSGGHAAGDRLLTQVAESVRGSLRPYDLSVRIGGDEIVCGLLDVSLEEAGPRFQALAADLREAAAPISYGLAQLLPGETMPTLLARADAAMYDQRHIDIRTATT